MKAKRKKSEAGANKLSLSKQRYIETIYHLQCCSGAENKHAHVKDIAKILNIKMASVTGAARYLKKIKLINYSARRQISLTQEGLEMAEKLQKKHKLVCQFLKNILHYPEDKAESLACEMEHIIDDFFIERLEKFLMETEN